MKTFAGPKGPASMLLLLTIACSNPRGEHKSVLSIVRGEEASTAAAPAFAVLPRQPRVSKAPCLNCHTKPLREMRWNGSDGHATAHWQIDLVHAPKNVMSCATCHTPDDPDRLRMLGGDPVGMDQAYLVCAQCHAKQRADWEGGAHGKRAVGWAESRVIFNCTECHNPHRPAFESRWPARAGRTDREP